jgi:hypothetical protein
VVPIIGLWRRSRFENPVTEPKRSQKSKRPLSSLQYPLRYSIYGYALTVTSRAGKKWPAGRMGKPAPPREACQTSGFLDVDISASFARFSALLRNKT